MKKKMTNYELVQVVNAMKNLANKRYPQKISYALMKSIIALEKESEIYTKQLESLTKKYKDDDKFVLDDKGEIVVNKNGIPKTKDEYTEEYSKELAELLSFVVEIEMPVISEEEFDYSDEKYDVLTPTEMIMLTNLICAK